MELTQVQYEQIADCFPKHGDSLTYYNLEMLYASLLYCYGCKWRALPGKYGNWHTVCYHIRRWAKNGVINRAFAELQEKQTVRFKTEVILMDRTSVRIRSDATGARKKTGSCPPVSLAVA